MEGMLGSPHDDPPGAEVPQLPETWRGNSSSDPARRTNAFDLVEGQQPRENLGIGEPKKLIPHARQALKEAGVVAALAEVREELDPRIGNGLVECRLKRILNVFVEVGIGSPHGCLE